MAAIRQWLSKIFPRRREPSWKNGLPNTPRSMQWRIGTIANAKARAITIGPARPPPGTRRDCWRRPAKSFPQAFWNSIRRSSGRTRMSASRSGPRMSRSNLHLAMLRFVHVRIIGGVGDIDDEGNIGLDGIGDLASPKQADLLLDVGDRADLRLQLRFPFPEQTQRFGH